MTRQEQGGKQSMRPLSLRRALQPHFGRPFAPTLDLTALDALNFALVHNSVPLVRELAISNPGTAPLEELAVTVELALYAKPWTGSIPRLAPGATHHFENLVFDYDEAALLNAAERDRVKLNVRVEQVREGQAPVVLAEQSKDVSILAYNEWRRDTVPQMLAAFVLPNHPNLSLVLDRARELLGRATGSPALGGYQEAEPGRTRAMAQAVYEAVGALDITYANPPASFEENGQKVRTPEQILNDRLATCVDISVLIAAALEQVGLHPLIVLVKGHAFPGVWLRDDYRGDGVFWDPASLRNELSLGSLVVFDSSAAVQRPAVPFAAAMAEAQRALTDDEAFRFALDVRGARSQKYLPLPSRVYGPHFGVVQEVRVDAPPAALVARAGAEPTASTDGARAEDSPEVQQAKARIRLWQRQLLDLTLRNRLLNFYTNGRHGVKLQCPNLARLEDHLATGQSFVLHGAPAVFSEQDERSVQVRRAKTGSDADVEYLNERLEEGVLHGTLSPDLHQAALQGVARKGKEAFEEAGAHTIFLALGLLRWYEDKSSEQDRFAPLVLLPVELKRGSLRDPWRIEASDEPAVFNPSLIEKLRVEFHVDLSSFGGELPGDDAGVDLPQVFATVRASIRGLDRWEVKEECHLGHFSFTKQMMWQDLGKLLELEELPPLLRALARPEERFPSGGGVPLEEELDANYPPGEVFCPLDSDSSQLASILAAANGESFVLQGPPGTGKSQTITNLIAHCLAVGKSVLFVAAKMAALQVVHRRLERVGVAPFCLELHSHSASKKAVLDQLSRALHEHAQEPPEWESRTSRLQEDRQRLNRYAQSLHRVRPQGASLRAGMATLLRLRSAPRVSIDLGSASALSQEDLGQRLRTLAEFVAVAHRVGPAQAHPLFGIRATVWSPAMADEFERRVGEVRRALQAVHGAIPALERHLGHSVTAATLDELEVLRKAIVAVATTEPVSRGLLQAAEPDRARDEALALVSLGEQRDAVQSELGAAYTEDLHRLDLDSLAMRLRTWGTAFFLIAWIMLWTTRRLLASVRSSGALPKNPELLRDVEAARKLRELRQRFEAALPSGRALLGIVNDSAQQWSTLRQQVERSRQLRAGLDALAHCPGVGGLAARDVLTHWVPNAAASEPPGAPSASAAPNAEALRCAQAFQQVFSAMTSALEGLVAAADIDLVASFAGNEPTLQGLDAVLEKYEHAVPNLRDWCMYQGQRRRLEGLPELALVEACERGDLGAAELEVAFERAYVQTWVSAEYSADPVLAQFDAGVHDTTVDRFRAQDSTLGRLTAGKAHAILASQIPRGDAGEMSVLRRELQKKARHKPIRRLFGEIANIRRKLKPCLLMSPLSVAQYLSPKDRFDIVVFDEASQLPTADTIGAIARGRQLIVVGDSKQLPPTNFFNRTADDEDASDEAGDELESILNECLAAQMRELRLRWHYRSQHEDLITFSNTRYYGKQLFTFAASDDAARRVGVSLVPVPKGCYAKGKARTNRLEAETLVNEVVRRLRDREEQKRSLGIVTFSMAQQRLVQDLLEAQCRKYPELEQYFKDDAVFEAVFVKNLENVQGDERDVVLFSVCYGPDEHGRVSMNFGPLNQEGGERRLNVAVTRARQQLIVYSTLRADQIDIRRTNAKGVHDLRNFLRYAEHGPRALAETIDVGGDLRFDSHFEEEVHEALEQRGHQLATQVGCSGYRIDLAIVDPERPGRFLLGIECDGAAYHSAKTARDRDRLRETVLRSLGWRIVRIWSTDWWTARDRALEKLDAAIAAARAEGGMRIIDGANSQAPATESPKEELVAKAARQTTDITPPPPAAVCTGEPYRIAVLADPPSPFDLDDPRALGDLIRDLTTVLAAEAPIHLQLIGARLASSWKITKVTNKKLRQLSRVIIDYELGVIHDDFVWPSGTSRPDFDTPRTPAHDGASRPIELIPIEEVMAATRRVLQHNHALERDELVRATAKLLGISRAGSRVAERVGEAIDRVVQSGAAVAQGTRVAAGE